MQTSFRGCACRENLSKAVWGPPEGGLVMKELKDYDPTVAQVCVFNTSTLDVRSLYLDPHFVHSLLL